MCCSTYAVSCKQKTRNNLDLGLCEPKRASMSAVKRGT